MDCDVSNIKLNAIYSSFWAFLSENARYLESPTFAPSLWGFDRVLMLSLYIGFSYDMADDKGGILEIPAVDIHVLTFPIGTPILSI